MELYPLSSFCPCRRAVAKMKAIEEDKEILHRTPTGRIPAIKRPYSCKYVVWMVFVLLNGLQ